ncbi:hypothetical protein M758_7G144800 [Ceratodon purpureus]|nr:hypothetical protein M758_7G144800 [Ceratodon purpureus]
MVVMSPATSPEKNRRRSARSSSGKNRSFFFFVILHLNPTNRFQFPDLCTPKDLPACDHPGSRGEKPLAHLATFTSANPLPSFKNQLSLIRFLSKTELLALSGIDTNRGATRARSEVTA